MSHLTIYTDGSSRGNPGPGGYGIVLMYGKHQKEIAEGYRYTTNNRMELMAVIVALESVTREDIPIDIYTDSQYVVNSVQKGWLQKWLQTNFAGGKKNSDLWIRYARVARKFTIQFHWVKGHADNPYNNRCDTLATSASMGTHLLIDTVFEQETPNLFSQ